MLAHSSQHPQSDHSNPHKICVVVSKNGQMACSMYASLPYQSIASCLAQILIRCCTRGPEYLIEIAYIDEIRLNAMKGDEQQMYLANLWLSWYNARMV